MSAKLIATFKHMSITRYGRIGVEESYTIRSQILLGHIRFYSPWGQWCFFPFADTVWSEDCLADVRKFMLGLKT